MSIVFGRNQYISPRLCLQVCVFLIVLTCGCASKKCPRFSFQGISSSMTIRASEGSAVTIPFRLDTSECSSAIGRSLYIYVSTPQKYDFCAVRLMPTGCTSTSNEKCACVDGTSADKGAVLTKTVTKADAGSWVWRTGDGTSRAEISFDIRDEPVTPPSKGEVTTEEINDDEDRVRYLQESTLNPKLDLKSQGGNDDSKDEKDGDDESGFVDSSMKTGLVVGGANIVTFLFIAFVIYMCRRKRENRGRRRPNEKLPPLPTEVKGDELVPIQGQGNDSGSNMTSGHYGEIPDAYDNDTYLEPVRNLNAEESSYTPLA